MIKTARPPGGANLSRGLVAGTLALSLVGSMTVPATATARQTASVCRVQFTGFSTVRYNPALDLSGFIIKGEHNYDPATRAGGSVSTDFEVLDNDGYLILYILMTEWQASGRLGRNRSQVVTYPRSDIVLALDAATMGLTYQSVLKAKVERDRPANAEDILQLLALKAEAMKMFHEGLRAALDRSPGGVDLPPGFLSARLGMVLDGLQEGTGQLMMAQYLDRPHEAAGPNVLCKPGAPSTLVGQVLCGTRFVDGAARDPAVCPEGLRLNPLSALPRCRRVGQQDQC